MSRHLGSVSELRRSRAYRSIARVALAGQLLTLLPAGATPSFAGQAPVTSAPSFVSVPSTDDTAIEALLADYLIGAEQRPTPHPNGAPSGPVTPAPEPNPVVVNRTVPNVAAPTPFAGFSSSPTDEEFLRGRIFEEALVPIGRATTPAENQALARALETYRREAPDAIAPIDAFLRQYPDTPWRASLLVNVGMRLRDAGAYSRALAMWDETWTLAHDATDPAGRAMADLALAEWLRLSMSLMRIDQVEARLASIGRRDVRGAAGNRIRQVRERLASWRAHPEWFVPAELRALDRLTSFERDKDGTATSRPPRPRATALSAAHAIDVKRPRRLGWLVGPAKRLGLTLRAMRRGAGAAFAAGTLVPMKNGQVLALLEPRGDRFLAYDPGLNRDLSVSRATLDEEASGVALMSSSSAAATAPGWTEIAAAALPELITLCPPGQPDDHEPCPCSSGAGPGGGPPGSGGAGPGPPGMPTYRFHQSVAGLVIQDEPVTYAVPRGPAARISLSYGSRSDEDPAVFTFGNLGPKWRFDWRAYIQEHPLNCWSGTCIDPEVRVTLRGGGWESHAPLTGSWTTLGPHQRSHAILVRTSASPVQYERRLPDGSKEVYGVSDGAVNGARVFLTDVVDPQGQAVHLTYDAQFRLVSLTDAIGQVTTLSYDHASDPLKITKVTDPFGRFATFTYNSAGQLESITDAIGLTSTFAYGDSDFIVAMMTPYGTTTFREENITPRALEATDPLGGTERVEYWFEHASLPATVPAAEVPTGFTAANHEMNEYVSLYWDKRAMGLQPRALASATVTKWLLRVGPDYLGGAPNTSIPYAIKRPLESRIWYQYPNQLVVGDDLMGMGMQPTVSARVLDDGSSQISQATYNTLGHVTSRTDPLGRRTSYVYAANNIDVLEVRQTTSNLNDLLATYSNFTSLHAPQTVTDASAQTIILTYNAAGQTLTVTNAKGETTTNTYDAAGYLLATTRPVVGATTTYAYDGFGRLRTLTTSDGYTVTRNYDALDRPTRLTYPDGTYEEFVYDRLHLAARRDRVGRWTRMTRDAVGRGVATRDPLGRVVTRVWCACGTLESLIDAKGQKTRWEYDLQGRVTREVRPDDTTAVVYTYEATTSRPKTVTDPKLQVTTYTYNVDNTVQSIAFTNATIATPPVAFTYETGYRRKATMVDGTGTTSYAYHPGGVLGAGQIANIDGPLSNDTITYVYDELGRATTRAVNGVGRTYAYDQLGRLATEVNPLGLFTHTYDGATPRLSTVGYPNGQTTEYVYFGSGNDRRLQTIHHRRADTSTLSKFDYTYDSAGSILTWQQQVDSAPPAMWRYSYDEAEQLTRAVKSSLGAAPTVLNRFGYIYDLAGNRRTEQIDNDVTAFTYDRLNRLVQQQGGGQLRFAGTVSEPATVTIQGTTAEVAATNAFSGATTVTSGANLVTIQATDPSGNVAAAQYQVTLGGNPRMVTYDANGNMTSDGTRVFEWDARNQLVAITIGTHRSEFTYDGLQQRVRTVERENGVIHSETLAIWCDSDICEERSPSGAVESRVYWYGIERPSGPVYLARDHLSSVEAVTDANSVLVARYSFDPFGRQTQTAGAGASEYRFTGHRTHGPSGLVLTLMRAYDPGVGRWLSVDPLGVDTSLNLYAYVDNRVLSEFDPYGLQGVKLPDCKFCNAQQTGQVNTATNKVCGNTAGGKCRQVLSQYNLLTCFTENCKNGFKLVCIKEQCPMAKNQCGGPCIGDFRHQMYITPRGFQEDGMCGALSDTMAHEMAHMCGVGNDGDQESPAHRRNKQIADNVGLACR